MGVCVRERERGRMGAILTERERERERERANTVVLFDDPSIDRRRMFNREQIRIL